MRTPMMAGNWKMNKTPDEAASLAQAIREQTSDHGDVDKVVCPTFVCLDAVGSVLEGSDVALGAQNLHWEASGAYTGEISAPMLADLVDYVIIGHSERRQMFGETDETVNKKMHAALDGGLVPILCVGETLAQNEANETQNIVTMQLEQALDGLNADQVRQSVIAYEPIWAIGTGRAATAEQAQEVCAMIRQVVGATHGEETASQTRVLYGGSTKPANIREIMQQPDIDGALIGGAALEAKSYGQMVKITSELYSE